MAERAVVTAVILLVTICICLYMVEVFVPIGKNMDFRDICRNYLMKMEYCSGLSRDDLSALKDRLEESGFCNVTATAPGSAKAGERISLHVRAEYIRDGLSGIFKREPTAHSMTYERTTVARKVINR